MNNVSLTVPYEVKALVRASEMLKGMAADLSKDIMDEQQLPLSEHVHAATAKVEDTTAPDSNSEFHAPLASIDGVDIYADTEITVAQHAQLFPEAQAAHTGRVVASPSVFADQPAAAPNETPASPTAGTASATQQATPPGVDLAPSTTDPNVSVPWDSRIHAGSKAKLAKSPNGWKMKRGVDSETVKAVEAELIAAMTATPAAPAPAAPAQTAPAAPAPAAPAPAAPAQTTADIGFPQLMERITSSGIDQATVTAALNTQGMAALPLLAARPDLVPAVYAELFPGG